MPGGLQGYQSIFNDHESSSSPESVGLPTVAASRSIIYKRVPFNLLLGRRCIVNQPSFLTRTHKMVWFLVSLHNVTHTTLLLCPKDWKNVPGRPLGYGRKRRTMTPRKSCSSLMTRSKIHCSVFMLYARYLLFYEETDTSQQPLHILHSRAQRIG